MNKIANKQVICEVLMEKAKNDKDVVVLCSDSRGSSSLTPYADAYPGQFVEVGIAEQSLVSISAGLARCGKKPYAASPVFPGPGLIHLVELLPQVRQGILRDGRPRVEYGNTGMSVLTGNFHLDHLFPLAVVDRVGVKIHQHFFRFKFVTPDIYRFRLVHPHIDAVLLGQDFGRLQVIAHHGRNVEALHGNGIIAKLQLV